MSAHSQFFKRGKHLKLASLLAMLALILAACQSAPIPATGPTATNAPAVQPTLAPTSAPVVEPTTAAAVEAEISVVSHPEFGDILVGNNDMTLYMFTKDEPNKSNCAGDCLVKWPPLLTQGDPVLGEGVDAALVGSTDLPDGTKIVTYNGMPLYYWINDKQAGDTTGQGVGEVWYVVSVAGEPVGMAATGEASPAAAASNDAEISVVDDPALGEILVGKDGMTLYMFTNDEPNKSNCAGDCLVKWPPLLTQGDPVLGEGVNPDLVSTADLPDGSKIVTYNGMPLYYWINDKQAGDTTGQGVGSVWYVVSPTGDPVGM